MNWTDTNNELPTQRTTCYLHLSLQTDDCETARTTSATFTLHKLTGGFVRYKQGFQSLITPSERIPVSYTHLDVYKRQE